MKCRVPQLFPPVFPPSIRSRQCPLMVWLVTVVLSLRVSAATITWDGEAADGSWHSPANWSGNALPGPADDVIINAGGALVVGLQSGTVRIRSLQCSSGLGLTGGELVLTAGNSTIAGPLNLGSGRLGAQGPGVTVTATGVITHAGAGLWVSGGARLSLATLTHLTRTTQGDISLTADGAGSRLDLPMVTAVTVADYYQLELIGTTGGQVRLAALATVNGALDVYADGTNSVVELSGLTGALVNTTPGSARLEARNGGAVLIPNVTSLERVTVVVRGSGQLPLSQLTSLRQGELILAANTNNWPGWTNLTGSDVLVEAGAQLTLAGIKQLQKTNVGALALTARGPGSVLRLPNLETGAVADYYLFGISAYQGGQVILSRLSALNGAINAYADGAGSLVDLPGLQGVLRNDGPGEAYLEARNDGVIQLPNVRALDRINLTLRGTGQIPIAQLTDYTGAEFTLDGTTRSLPGLTNLAGSDLTVLQGARLSLAGVTRLSKPTVGSLTLTARDPESVLNLPNVVAGAVQDYYFLSLRTWSGGQILLPQLSSLAGAIDAYADGPGSLVDLPAFQGLWRNDRPGAAYLEARNGGTVRIVNVTALDRINVTLRGSGTIPLSQLTAFTRARLTFDGAIQSLPGLTDLHGSDVTVENGAQLTLAGVTQLTNTNIGNLILTVRSGSTLDLPNVTAATVRDYYLLSLHATDGGRLLLPRLVLLNAAIDAYAQGPGSLVDLSGLQGALLNPSPGAAYLEARDGGELWLPNVTSLDRFNLTIRTTGQIPTAQLTAITRSSVTIDGATAAFGGLADTTGSTFSYANGGTAIFLPPADLRITAIRAPASAVANQPVEIAWQLTNLGTGLTNALWSDGLFLSADPAPGSDTLLGLVSVQGSLTNGASLWVTNRVQFPAQHSGSWYPVVAANQSRSVWEGTNTFNNTNIATTPILIQAPDLVIDAVSVQPANIQFGQSVTVSWTVRNAGTAAAPAGWNEGLFLARNPASLAGAVPLSSVTASEPLAPGQTRARSKTITVPLSAGWTAGTFNLLSVADVGHTLAEAQETNNLRAATLGVALPPLPDLMATRLQATSTTALPGQLLEVAWTVTNAGPALARGGWTEALYLTRTNAGAVAQPILLLSATNDLGAGAAFTRTQQMLLPDDLRAGTVRLTLDVDPEDALFESNEANNGRSSDTLLSVPAQLQLRFPFTEVAEDTPTPTLTALLTRNGDPAVPLTVSLTSSLPGELSLPASVVLAAGVASVPVPFTIQRDGIPDGDRSVTVTASAPAYAPATSAVVVRNADLAHLSLQSPVSSVVEGGSVSVTLGRDGPTASALSVELTTSGTGQLLAPTRVTLPAGQATIAVAVSATDDTRVELSRTATITAAAPGLVGTSIALTVVDDDLPELTFTLAANSVSEGAGNEATTATIARVPASPRSLDIALENSHPNVATLPDRIVIPAGQASVSFPIGVKDDTLVNEPRSATLRAFAEATLTGVRVAQSAPVTLTVRDDDSPRLAITVSHDLLPEGLANATTVTVSRNSTTNLALLVNLASSDTGEATLPSTLTILAGRASATATLTTLDDQTDDGSQPVRLTASAPGHADGLTDVLVTDVNRPDLVISELSGPDTAETESFINLSYRVVNQGLAPAGTNWTTRVVLSRDATPGDDTFLADYAFNGTLPVGQFFGQSRQIRLPQEPGDYWLIASTDTSTQIDEIREDNNSALSVRPIRVTPAYQAVVETDLESAMAGTAVPLRGTATRTLTGGPAPFVLVNIHLRVRGTERIISALTDETGQFTATFNPLRGEAGLYEIGAAHPGMRQAPIQDSFTLFGMRAEPIAPVQLPEGTSLTGQIPIQNLGDLPLTGVTVTVVSHPPNLRVSAALAGGGTIEALSSVALGFAITANDGSVTEDPVVRLHLTSAQGAALDFALPVTVVKLAPRLVARPEELLAGMKRGGQAFVEFDVINEGGAASGPIQVVLPEFPWMHMVSANPLPSLEPGATNRVTLQLTPSADLALGPYTGTLALNTATTSRTLPFQFLALSEAKGDLRITAVDEYTYYAEGAPRLAGAAVTVRDAVTEQVITQGVTDADGEFVVAQVPEGYYEIQISADQHRGYRDTSLVLAGFETPVTAFLSRQAVRYLWTVTPTEIEDRTRITIETVFEAFVPMPVITIDPPLIDLADYTAEVTQIDLKITNHGLIAAKEGQLSFGSHPDWAFEPLINDLGDLPARSSLTIPLLIRRLDVPTRALAPAARISKHAGGGGCSVSGACNFVVECGGVNIGSGAPVIIVNAKGNCGGGGGGVVGGAAGGGGGGGGAGGGGPGDSSASIRSCDSCMPKVLDCIIDFTIPDWADCAKDLKGCLDSGGLWDCTKAALTCAEFGGAELLGGVNKGIDVKECLEGLQEGCQSTPSGGGGGGGSTAGARLAKSSLRKTATDNSWIERGEFAFVRERADWVLQEVAPLRYLFGNDAWFEPTPVPATDWIHGFLQRIEPATDAGTRISTAEASQLLALPRPAAVNTVLAQAFISRWNRSLDYWDRGILNQADVPAGENPDFLAADVLTRLTLAAVEADARAVAAGYASTSHALSQAREEFRNFLGEGDSGGVCAHVRIRLDQDLVSTRDAFNATLEIENVLDESLDQILVDLTIRRRNGEDVTDLFALFPPALSGVTAIDGSGTLDPGLTGTIRWLLVPTTDAVRAEPEEFLVSGVLRYRQGPLTLNVPLAAATITVLPSPSLAVKYFHQRDVLGDDPFTAEIEPSVPYSLAVMVQNHGHGAARNVHIRSAQPRIVENEKGLLVDFKILATEVAGQNLQPSLTVDFGRIDPGTNAIGRWLLTSTLLGGFIEYSAAIEHLDGLGHKKLALVEGVEIHELNHIVRALGARDDGRPDFLVNDVVDLYDRPDTLHLSDGSVEPVSLVTAATVDGIPTANDLEVVLTASFPTGWAYLRIADPGTNQFRLARVVRSDGREIPLGDNVWTTDRTFLGNARRPLRENLLHLFDDQSTGQYTLYYANLPPQDVTPPASQVEPLPAESSARIPVAWNAQDNPGGSGVSFYDVYVSIDNGPFLLWEKETLDRTGFYQGALNRSYAFYSIATDLAGNREEPPLVADAHTIVTRVNRAPILEPIADRVVREGDTLVVEPLASDPDGDSLVFSLGTNAPAGMVLQPYTGRITWVTGEGSGPTNYPLTLQVLDTGSPRLGAVRSFTVTVSDDNSPPVLSPIANWTISEGRLLIITNRVQDYDLPPQKLTFTFGTPPPAGATLHPDTGVFQWEPSNVQGGTTNRFLIVVRDSGTPNLTASQSFSVIVRDTRGDFLVGLGSTNLLAGETTTLPLVLDSGPDLTQIGFELHAPDPHLASLALIPTANEVVSSVLEPLGNGLYRVRIELDSSLGNSGPRTLGNLSIDTAAVGKSSIARLMLDHLSGLRLGGTVVTNALARSARLFVIEEEPLLDAEFVSNDAIRLVIYSRPGSTLRLERAPGAAHSPLWQEVQTLSSPGSFRVIDWSTLNSADLYFRVLRE